MAEAGIRTIRLKEHRFAPLECTPQGFYEPADTIPIRRQIRAQREGDPEQVQVAEVVTWVTQRCGQPSFQACEAIRPGMPCKLYFDCEMMDETRQEPASTEEVVEELLAWME